MTNVYRRRAQIGALLRRQLSDQSLVVPNPDHPLLIRGPDIIVSTDRVLSALFVPSSEELRAHTALKSRLVLSRLALPSLTRFFLIVDSHEDRLANSFANDFAEIIRWPRRTTIPQIATNVEFARRHRDVPSDIVGAAQLRFERAMTVMRLSARISGKPFTSAFGGRADLESIEAFNAPSRRLPRRRPLVVRDPEGVALAEMSDLKVDATSVRSLIDDEVDQAYVLDNGVPYQRAKPGGIAVVRTWPVGGRDRGKLIHAAAFGGWAFVLEQTRGELDKFARSLRRERTTR